MYKKYRTYIFSFLFVFLLAETLLDGVVSIQFINFPSRISYEKNIPFNIRITKANLIGPAQLKIILPDGFIISPEYISPLISFTQEGNVAIFIWFSMEADERSIDIPCTLNTEWATVGKYTIKSSFSYLNEGTRRRKEMVLSDIEIVSEQFKDALITDREYLSGITVSRDVNHVSEDKVQIILNIRHNDHIIGKDSIEKLVVREVFGFPIEQGRRLIIDKPNNSTIEIHEKEESFSFRLRDLDRKTHTLSYIVVFDKTMKELPIKTLVTLHNRDIILNKSIIPIDNLTQYTLQKTQPSSDNTSKEEAIAETLSPLHELLLKDSSTFEQQNVSPVFAKNDVYTTKDEKSDTKTASKNTVVSTKKKHIQGIVSSPQSYDGISYRVQFLAMQSNKKINKKVLKKHYRYADKYLLERHKGWRKYTSEKEFTVYSDSKKYKKRLEKKHPFPHPFVIAYNNGNRITVQEALIISKQEWLK